MLLKLFLAFTIIPVVEIYLLIQIGSAFGAFTSIALVIFTGFLGAYLARIQGLQTLFRIQESLREGRNLYGHTGSAVDALNHRNHFHHPVPKSDQASSQHLGRE